MRPTRLLLAIALTLTPLFISPAQAETKKPTAIVFDAGNPPFAFAEKGGALNGIYPKIIIEAFKRMNEPLDATAMPWVRALKRTDEGVSATAGLYKNTERLKKYDFSDPIYVEKLKIYTLREKAFDYREINDLKGMTLGVVRGWSYGDTFDEAREKNIFTAIPTNNDYTNLQKLSENRIDAIIAAPETLDSLIKEKGFHAKIVALPHPATTNETFIAFNKRAGASDLLIRFNAALQSMKDDGAYQKLSTITPDMQ